MQHNETQEVTQDRIKRLEQECKDLMDKIKQHNDPGSDSFQEIKQAYADKKKELRYLKSTI